MQESNEPNKPAPASPDPDAAQLLKILELQRQARPSRPEPMGNPFSGTAFRYGSLIAIVLGTIVAVLFLEWFASQIPHQVRNAPPLHGPPSPTPQP